MECGKKETALSNRVPVPFPNTFSKTVYHPTLKNCNALRTSGRVLQCTTCIATPCLAGGFFVNCGGVVDPNHQ
eukprot:979186-Amphidinium_carterae.1